MSKVHTILAVEPLLVGPELAAGLLGISRSTFDRRERCGDIGPRPVSLTDGRKLYRLTDLRAWVEGGCPSRVVWDNRSDDRRLRMTGGG